MSKVILITGTSTGFGRDAAETLAQAGNYVFASMRDIAGRNKEHADALRAKNIEVVELDVTDDASVTEAVAYVLKHAGRIDVLINNAGMGGAGISETYTTEQVRTLFEVNVFSIQRTLRAVLPILRKQGHGLIINLGSVLGRTTLPFLGVYGATKFALDAISQSYRYELSPFGIKVTLVQPSAYPTNIYAAALVPADAERTDTYGDVKIALGDMLKGFGQMLSGPNAPDPHEVVEAIANLIAEPLESAPARLVVGAPFGADAINATAASAQTRALAALGLSGLEPASDKVGA